MLVTVTCVSNDVVYSLNVSPDIELENFKVLVQSESSLQDVTDLVFFHNGKILVGDKKSLSELGVSNNDVLMFGPRPVGASGMNPLFRASNPSASSSAQAGAFGINWAGIQIPTSSNSRPQPQSSSQSRSSASMEESESLRIELKMNAHQLSLLKERNPKLAEAIDDPEKFREVLSAQHSERLEKERSRRNVLMKDPFGLEAQKLIEEEIRMENVNQNMQTAMEYNPEAFAQVYMLYIDCKVNGQPVKAFVDSGAQMTIMSNRCAERCSITKLVDYRWQGMAVGVGKQKILGRVHMCELQIENVFLPTSFTILEEQAMDILFGLDMLKRHQCCIDLKRNCLVIGTTGTETRFLNESELPACARLNTVNQSGDTDEDRDLAEAIEKSQRE